MAYNWLTEDETIPEIINYAITEQGPIDLTGILDCYNMEFRPENDHRPNSVWIYDVANKAGFNHGWDPYRPKGWCRFSTPVAPGIDEFGTGDIMVFNTSETELAVSICIGEDEECYHVIGALDNVEACISRVPKENLKFARNNPVEKYPMLQLTEAGDLI